MASEFVTKNKPTGKEYLEAPLEEVIDRANKSTNESEIPFVSAVLSAKANRDQRQAAKQTFFTAIASVAVAVLALVSSVLICLAQSKQEDTLQAELVSLSGKYDALNQRLQQSEVERAHLAEHLSAIQKSQDSTATLLQTTLSNVLQHEAAHCNAPVKPPATKPVEPK